MDGADPFDDLLGLEDQFYDEGYQLGIADGRSAGKIEGRIFGLEKGFEKYVEIGKLHGRSVVWAARIPEGEVTEKDLTAVSREDQIGDLPKLSKNPRLEKHVKVLYALVERDTLSTENTEESVSDFDDRLKRAQGKVKMIEKLVGEENGIIEGASGQQQSSSGGGGNNIEDVDILKARH